MAPWGVPCHAMGGTMATPVGTATALHVNLTACHGHPHGTPMSTAPGVRVRVWVRVPWYVVKVRGRLRGMLWMMPWKGLPQVVPRHVAKKDNAVHARRGEVSLGAQERTKRKVTLYIHRFFHR